MAPLAFAFAVALPLVAALYFLKRKRVARLVSSTLLWQRFLAETQASSPFQKLRKNWLLLLQLLLLALAVFALARPYLAAHTKPARLRIVILDSSASMQATDETPSRFEKARAEALKWVDNLGDEDKLMVLQAGAVTEVRQSATGDKAALRRALQACVCSDGPTRLVPALRMAASLVRNQPGAEVELFSDGAAPDLSEFQQQALPLVYHKLGNSSNNIGITALSARENPENPRQRAIYASIGNFSSNSVSTELQLMLDDRLLETRAVKIDPGETLPQVFLAEQTQDGVFTLRVKAEDDLDTDNQASIASFLPKPLEVLLVTRGNRLLEKALRASPRVELSTAADLTNPVSDFDFVVLDNVRPSVWPSGNVLAFHVANTNWADSISPVETPALVDWRSAHPLLRYAGFDNVQVARGLSAKAPPWSVSLLDTPQSSLMFAGEFGKQRIIWIGFDALESNWPLRVSFPIFIANAVDWLNPASTRDAQRLVKPGEAFRLPLAKSETRAQVTFPGGAIQTVPLDPNANEFVFGRTFQQGVYRVRLGTNDFVFCADLLDPAESNIKPKDILQLGQYTTIAASGTQRSNVELWRAFGGAALAILMFEWWFYHRRTV